MKRKVKVLAQNEKEERVLAQNEERVIVIFTLINILYMSATTTSFCRRYKVIENTVGLLIQILLIFAFLTIFFFTYVKNAEKKIFEKQVNIVVDDIAKELFIDLSLLNKKDIQSLIKQAINNFPVPDHPDSSIDANNKKIMKKAFSMLFVLTIILLSSILLLSSLKICVNFVPNVKYSLFSLLFIALTEFMFLNIVARNYISVDPNKVRRIALNVIVQYVNSKNM